MKIYFLGKYKNPLNDHKSDRTAHLLKIQKNKNGTIIFCVPRNKYIYIYMRKILVQMKKICKCNKF